jgi:hypothetical protein
MGHRYPLSLINDNNNFTGADLIVITIGDLNLASAMMKVYNFKYAPRIDALISGLLPYDQSRHALTTCVCPGNRYD